jgi:hypothetical protein
MHTTLTLNGRTLLNDNLDQWQQRPPQQLQELIKPGHKPQPWIQAALITLADAAMNSQPIEIHITTKPTGWTINVQHPTGR